MVKILVNSFKIVKYFLNLDPYVLCIRYVIINHILLPSSNKNNHNKEFKFQTHLTKVRRTQITTFSLISTIFWHSTNTIRNKRCWWYSLYKKHLSEKKYSQSLQEGSWNRRKINNIDSDAFSLPHLENIYGGFLQKNVKVKNVYLPQAKHSLTVDWIRF